MRKENLWKKKEIEKKKETKTILNIIEYARSPRRHERW